MPAAVTTITTGEETTMNEQELQAIEERAKRADGTNITNAIHDSDGCTHADYTFVEWALEDVLALIAEVRSLRAKLDAVPVGTPDWEDSPRWAQWWAVDCDGEAYWFEAEPTRCSSVWDSAPGGMARVQACGYVDVDRINWRNSLIQRPQAVQP